MIDVWEHHLPVALSIGSDNAKRHYVADLAAQLSSLVALYVRAAPADPGAAGVALRSALAWKGRVLDALTDTFASLRRSSPQDVQQLLAEIRLTQNRMATLSVKGPQGGDIQAFRSALDTLEADLQTLEAQLSRKSDGYRAQTQPITVDAVQKALPADAALVELVWYLPGALNSTPSSEPPRYAALVLRKNGPAQGVDLGDTATIDAAIGVMRKALSNPDVKDFKPAARALHALTMQKIEPLVGNAALLLIAPDSELNVIPFAALMDGQDRFLVEKFNIAYLSSGRDLLRMQQTAARARSGPVLVTSPEFGHETTATTTSRKGSLLRDVDFLPLPGTVAEAKAIKSVMKDSKLLNGAGATEAAFKQLKGPRVLHVATHGFYLDDKGLPTAGTRGLKLKPRKEAEAPVRSDNPLLRSGLALAGVNTGGHAGEDGVLTAMEVSGLDLTGTELVVLSACETGLGSVQPGEGVLGLRRALVIAGSRTQMMSLWAVDDDATRALMSDYYKQLMRGGARGASLREVQLRMIKDQNTAHPFFWAAFIESGDWRPLPPQ